MFWLTFRFPHSFPHFKSLKIISVEETESLDKIKHLYIYNLGEKYKQKFSLDYLS
jgi:hypothetical protein